MPAFRMPGFFSHRYGLVLIVFILLCLAAAAWTTANSRYVTPTAVIEHLATDAGLAIAGIVAEDKKANPPNANALSAEAQRLIKEAVLVRLDTFEHRSILYKLLEEVALALTIAALLIVTVEWYTTTRAHREVAQSVLDAVFQKVVDPSVFEAVKAQVLQAPAVREKYSYSVAYSLPAPNATYLVATATHRYWIRNISFRRWLPLSFAIHFNLDPGPVPLATNRIKRFEVGGRPVPLTSNTIAHPISIWPNRPVEVLIETEDTSPQPIHSDTWTMTEMVETLTVEIEAPGLPNLAFDVVAHHPNRSILQKDPSKLKWTYAGVLLPGQGWQVDIRPVAFTSSKGAGATVPASPPPVIPII